jgi:hypothetical protein
MKNVFTHITAYLVLGFILILPSKINGQTMLLSVEEPELAEEDNFGPNQKRYYHFSAGAGFIAGPSNAGAEIHYFRSFYYDFALRYKFQLTPVNAVGLEAIAHNRHFVLKSEPGKMIGSAEIHEFEKIILQTVGIEGFKRFNFDPERGNTIGIFTDIGASGAFVHSASVRTRDVIEQGVERTTVRGLPSINRFHGYVFNRIGYHRFVLKTTFRFTPAFKQDSNLPELPRLTAGLEIGLF